MLDDGPDEVAAADTTRRRDINRGEELSRGALSRGCRLHVTCSARLLAAFAPAASAAPAARAGCMRSGKVRERDPICDVCGHNHVQGVKCTICGHVGKYIVPGGPNRPNRGAIPPMPPGPLHMPNVTPPTIEGLSVRQFQEALQTFFEQINAQAEVPQLPPELSNLDQLKVLLDALADYHADVEQPSYVLAIPCRPVVLGLSSMGLTCLASVEWGSLITHAAADAQLSQPVDWSVALS